MSVYYNEIDEFAIGWLRNLIAAGVLPDGEVDTRSITDVRADDLRGFRQCHFFAGIGGWAYALRLAGWPDEREVWTGSCPCQPYSVAGRGEGTADPRHLWPTWFPLIRERRPSTVFGEQVASKDGEYWLDLVLPDLEGISYAVGAFDLPAAGVGSPQRRQRFWFVADNVSHGRGELAEARVHERRAAALGEVDPAGDANGARRHDALRRGADGGRVVGDAENVRRKRDARGRRAAGDGTQRSGELVLAGGSGLEGLAGNGDDGDQPGWFGAGAGRHAAAAGATGGFWSPVEWVRCSDGKARPVEPGSFPLAHGIPARVGRLRGYGNAIVPQVAAIVIRSYMDARGL